MKPAVTANPQTRKETTMQYILLIYNNESQPMPAEERGKMFQEYVAFTQDIVKSGKFKAGDPLQPTSTATTVRVRNGKTATVDGPFAETKEQLGGYYIVEAENLDEAVAIAARIPGARTGSIEVRPIMAMHS
jgi:hypothetical protein